MAVFAVLASSSSSALDDAILKLIASQDHYRVDDHTWFVNAPQQIVTPKELSDFLGISGGAAGRVLVLHITAYYGYHAKEAWDWLSVKGV